MEELFLPSLSHWQLGNCWSGSFGRASYHVTPRGEEKQPPHELYAEVWTGPLCYELSTAERTETFPISEDGLAALREWLEVNLGELDAAAREA